MQDFRRLLLVAILAWSASAVAVHAEDDGSSGEHCNAFCRFWLGRGDRQPDAPPPVTAAEAPPPIGAAPPDEPEALPRVRLKTNRGRRAASAPGREREPAAVPADEGQGAAPDAARPPGAASAQPMDLTPEEAAAAAAEPPAVARPTPVPPPRPAMRGRQTRVGQWKRPVPPARSPAAEPQPMPRDMAGPGGATGSVKDGAARAPASPSGSPVAHAIAVAPRPPATAAARLPAPSVRSTPPADRGIAGLPAAAPSLSSTPGTAPLDGRTLPERDARLPGLTPGAPRVDPKRLHDVAPGPRPAGAVTQTSSIPRAPTRPARADPEDALEDLKATIMRSAQEALKQSEVHGF